MCAPTGFFDNCREAGIVGENCSAKRTQIARKYKGWIEERRFGAPQERTKYEQRRTTEMNYRCTGPTACLPASVEHSARSTGPDVPRFPGYPEDGVHRDLPVPNNSERSTGGRVASAAAPPCRSLQVARAPRRGDEPACGGARGCLGCSGAEGGTGFAAGIAGLRPLRG